jgi:hypothetical protein
LPVQRHLVRRLLMLVAAAFVLAYSSMLAAGAAQVGARSFVGTNWSAIAYPGSNGPNGCSGSGTRVAQVSYEEVSRTKSVALVLVYCNVMSGQFVMLYAFEPGSVPSQPRYLQTLLSVEPSRWVAVRFSASRTRVSMDAARGGPLCCPNIFRALRWTWQQGKFVAGPATRITSEQYHANMQSR